MRGEELRTSETSGYIFNIEDVEITLLVDSGAKKIFSEKVKSARGGTHIHPYYEFFFVEYGLINAVFSDKTDQILQNDIAIIAPGTAHITFNEGVKTCLYNLNLSVRRNGVRRGNSLYYRLNTILSSPYRIVRNCEGINETIKNIYASTEKKDVMMLAFYIHEFMIKIISCSLQTMTSNGENFVEYDTDMMRLHKIGVLINPRRRDFFTLKEIASFLQLSTRQTDRIIQKHYGVHYGELLVNKKMTYAAELLRNTQMSVTEISKELGYASTKGFYCAFKKKYGCLPLEYRKREEK